MKALSHPIRRDIVSRLRERPMSAGDLAAHYDVSKPTMSAHFAALRDAELLIAQREGVSIVYRLNMTIMEEALGAMMSLLSSGEDAKQLAKDPHDSQAPA